MSQDDETIEVTALLRDIAAGGAAAEQATERLYLMYATRLHRYYERRGIDPATSEDWAHDVLIRICTKAGEFSARGNAAAWIWRIARNRMIDELRKSRDTQTLDELEEVGATPAPLVTADASREGAQRVELQDCIERQFAAFRDAHPNLAQPMIWTVVDKLSTAEIAELLGRTSGATREFLSQSRKKLRHFLRVCYDMVSA